MTEIVCDYELAARARVSPGSSAELLHRQAAHTVIPGATVRGALAACWWTDHSDASAFVNLFERGLVIRQAVPANAELEAMSMWKCKYPGDGCDTSWTDEADAWLVGDQQPRTQCPACRGGIERGKGWRSSTPASRTTHTALTAAGTPQDGQLYACESIEKGTRLTGTLLVNEPDAIGWLERERTLRVGRRRTVMGAVSWTCRRVEVRNSPAARPAERLIIRTRSPLIILDEYGANTVDPAALAIELVRVGAAAGQAAPTVVRSWPRPVQVVGWHMRSQQPKPTEWAFEAGSTFVVDGLNVDAEERLRPGLGFRTLEGYGEVDVLRPVVAAP